EDVEGFEELYPQLVHLAKSEEEREELAKLKLPQRPSSPAPTQAVSETTQVAPIIPYQSSQSTTLGFAAIPFSQEAWLSILKINRALITEYQPQALFKKILEYASELS